MAPRRPKRNIRRPMMRPTNVSNARGLYAQTPTLNAKAPSFIPDPGYSLTKSSLNPNAPSFKPSEGVTHTASAEIVISHINVNRLLHKIHKIQDLVHTKKISVLAISETWLDHEVSEGEVTIPGYRFLRRDRAGKRGGGVGIYVHHTLNLKVDKDLDHPDIESIWVTVSNGHSTPLTIGCIYRPPDAKVKFWKDLEVLTEGLEGNDLVILGDLNVDTLNISDHNLNNLNSITSPLSLRNIIQEPTRLSANSATCIDLILTNNTNIQKASVEHLDISDHALVSCSLCIPNEKAKPIQKPTVKSRRKWSNATGSIDSLANAIERHMDTMTSNGINDMWIEWRDKFIASLDEVAPRVSYVTKKKPRCPWMTPDLLHKIHIQKKPPQKNSTHKIQGSRCCCKAPQVTELH